MTQINLSTWFESSRNLAGHLITVMTFVASPTQAFLSSQINNSSIPITLTFLQKRSMLQFSFSYGDVYRQLPLSPQTQYQSDKDDDPNEDILSKQG